MFVGGVRCGMVLMMFVVMMLMAAVAGIIVMVMVFMAAVAGIIVVVMVLVPTITGVVVVMLMLMIAVTNRGVGMSMNMRVRLCMRVGVRKTFGRRCRHRGFVECHRDSLLIYI